MSMHLETIEAAESAHLAETTGTQAFRLALGAFGARSLAVLRVRGREALSRPYAWEVTFATGERSFGAAAVLGQAARLTIAPLSETPREVLGVVAELTTGARVEHGLRVYRARIVPRLALLKTRRTSRVFEDLRVPEIVSAVLDRSGVPHRWETRAEYAPRAYCVQYGETDLAFVRRLCAEAGLWFRFDTPEHADRPGATELVTFGDSEAAPELEGGGLLLFRPSRGSALLGDDRHVTRLDARRRVSPAAITVRGYDFRRPALPIEARAEHDAPSAETGELYEHHDRDEDAKDAESGLVRAFLDQLAHDAHTAEGESVCPRLAPGRRFVLDGQEDAHEPGAHVVTTIRHEGRAARVAGEAATYDNRFVCLPASVAPRPPRPRRRVQTVTETAIVVGPEGSEIHTDEHGRVRVRFHWQRDGAKGDGDACWARVAEPWAGTSWGSQWIPRVGMEVLVAFLAGDASRPVVLGCLRNATHPAPFVLPRDRTTSGIRSRSTPGGDGYNEIAFADAKGAELLRLRAERDLAQLAQHDSLQATGHDATIAVGNDRTTHVTRTDTLDVGEKLAITVAGSAFQEMSDQRLAQGSGGGATLGLANGDATLQAKGNLRLSAGGDIAIDAAGNLTIRAGGTITIQAAGALAIEGATIDAIASGAIVIQGATVDLNP